MILVNKSKYSSYDIGNVPEKYLTPNIIARKEELFAETKKNQIEQLKKTIEESKTKLSELTKLG